MCESVPPDTMRSPWSCSTFASTRAFFGEHLGRQADDVWGLVLLLSGVLVGLGIFFDLTGPFGRAVRSGTGALLGTGRVLVPFALLAVGYVLVRGRPREEVASEFSLSPKPFEEFFFLLLSFEARLVASMRLPFGSTAFVLAEKPVQGTSVAAK